MPDPFPHLPPLCFSVFKRRLYIFVLFLILIVVLGMLAYAVLEHMSLKDALYSTIATVGGWGFKFENKLTVMLAGIMMVLEWLCIWLIFQTIIEGVTEGTIKEWLSSGIMKRTARKLKDHYVVVGFGRVGAEIARQLVKKGKKTVIIERDSEAACRAINAHFTVIQGDILEEKTLMEAGVQNARVLVAALGSDADNIFVTLSAKHLNPNVKIVARAAHVDTVEKLRQAGAKEIIMPEIIGGRALADAALKH